MSGPQQSHSGLITRYLGLGPDPARTAAQTGEADDEGSNHGPYLNRVVWTLAALSGLFLGLRVYCKLSRKRKLWWDDHFLTASWVRFSWIS